MPGIFNRAIFNDAIFNTAQVSGGYQYIGGDFDIGRRRSKEELQEQREALGIIPKAVEKVIAKVARQEASNDLEIALTTALHRELDKARLSYRTKYAEVLRLEVEARRIRQQDDEVAILLLI